MSTLACLRCKETIDADNEQCPSCGEKVTSFQRTYSTRLIDGKYQILDRLGIGGMGEIFKVRHIHLNELRVIKIMRPNVAADDQGLQRFLQEARTSTMIKHKNLAMLYDFSQLDDGSYYMVWEFIDGTNIQKWIAQNGPVPGRLAIEMSIQSLSGLDHLHSMGLIHRDVSPENIMLSQDHHGKLAVKVIDFGIAKQLAEGEGGQGLTQTGMFLGKLKYASPEQAGFLKEGEHLDPRSDLYSYGIVLYEMLAGRAPFHATNPHGYILKHVTEKPLPIHELNPEVTVAPQLEAILQRSLEKNRDNRYATAADFASALEGIRASIPPDQKFGLGERMITLSGAQTLADLPRMTTTGSGTMAGQTQGMGGTQGMGRTVTGPKAGPTGTRAANDEATVMEPGLRSGTLAESTPTVMERKTNAADEATVMEKLGGPSPKRTVVSGRAPAPVDSAAEPTVMERQLSPGEYGVPKKKNTAMMAAIAAVVVIALGVGGYFFTHQQPPVVVTATAPVSGTQVTTTTNATPAIPAGQGVLLLSASPWGDLEKIIKKSDQKAVTITDESTPARITLDPGSYEVTLNGPKGPKKFDVEITAGQAVAHNEPMSDISYDDLEKEVTQQ